MNDKDIKINNDDIQKISDDTEISIIGSEIDESSDAVGVIVPPAIVPKGKVTPGRRLRDSARKGGRGDAPGNLRGRDGGRKGEGRERVKPEFDSRTIGVRRVTRVAAGGRRYSFSVAVVAGDHKGRVGVGLGKGSDTALSVEKATREAKKHLIKVQLSPQMIIPHAAEAKFGSAEVKIFPARGRGVVAGSSARTVIELAGIKDVCAKVISGSKNKINIARATVTALRNLSKISRADLKIKKSS